MKIFYRRKLPHLTPPGGTFFITSRLYGSLPQSVLRRLKSEREAAVEKVLNDRSLTREKQEELFLRINKQYFKKWDDYLDQVICGPDYLRRPEVAQVVLDKLKEYDGSHYRLIAATIMPNHIHFLIDTYIQIERLPKGVRPNDQNYVSLAKIMQLIKGGSSYQANRIIGRKSAFWQRESYDHLVRNKHEFFNIIYYIRDNSVKARLVKAWTEWPFTYINETYLTLLDEVDHSKS